MCSLSAHCLLPFLLNAQADGSAKKDVAEKDNAPNVEVDLAPSKEADEPVVPEAPSAAEPVLETAPPPGQAAEKAEEAPLVEPGYSSDDDDPAQPTAAADPVDPAAVADDGEPCMVEDGGPPADIDLRNVIDTLAARVAAGAMPQVRFQNVDGISRNLDGLWVDFHGTLYRTGDLKSSTFGLGFRAFLTDQMLRTAVRGAPVGHNAICSRL